MSEKSRIEKVILMEGLTSGQFAQEIGIQNSTLSHILNERNNPSLDVMKKILSRFQNINADWLILGQGPMLRQESHSQMPSLFGEEDEILSETESYASEETENNLSDFSTIQKKVLRSVPEPTYARLRQERTTTDNQENTAATHTNQHDKSEPNNIPSSKQIESVDFDMKQSVIVDKKVVKIILYYSDNTFQEFDSK